MVRLFHFILIVSSFLNLKHTILKQRNKDTLGANRGNPTSWFLNTSSAQSTRIQTRSNQNLHQTIVLLQSPTRLKIYNAFVASSSPQQLYWLRIRPWNTPQDQKDNANIKNNKLFLTIKKKNQIKCSIPYCITGVTYNYDISHYISCKWYDTWLVHIHHKCNQRNHRTKNLNVCLQPRQS